MFIFVSLIHVVMSVTLILIVLLQSGKGTDLASAFGGGGSQTIFGSHGAASFMNKLTTVAAIMYMVTSLTLAILSAQPESSMMEDVQVPADQVETTTPPTGPEGLPLESETTATDEVPVTTSEPLESTQTETDISVDTDSTQTSDDVSEKPADPDNAGPEK